MSDQATETPGDGPESLFRFESGSPVRDDSPGRERPPSPGIGLALSGGGYRAMLFHVGVIVRLNEAGILRTVQRVSSVSGGSITAAVLGQSWSALDFDDSTGVSDEITARLVGPIRELARTRVDVPAVLGGLALPFTSIADRVERKLNRTLFRDATLADLPESPSFVINATNLESGVLIRFSRRYIADYRVGMIDDPTVPLATAVAASAAFPPFLSPYEFDGSDQRWKTVQGNDLTGADYRDELFLSDGGVYDNLGLEAVWKAYETVLVSDAGGHFHPDPEPDRDWGRHMLRILRIMDSQVRALRKRLTIDGFQRGDRGGFYISTTSMPDKYPHGPHLPVAPEVARRLASIPTRLSPIDEEHQELLINWGYAAADAGIRGYLDERTPPGTLPYPARPLT